MNERIKELRKQVSIDMHLHNIEDIRAMEGCFGQEGGNKIVNDYIEKFAELIVRECANYALEKGKASPDTDFRTGSLVISEFLLAHYGVEE